MRELGGSDFGRRGRRLRRIDEEQADASDWIDRLKKPDAIRATILKKTGRLTGFAAAAGVPLLALCATAKDTYRKPDVGAWNFFCEKCARKAVPPPSLRKNSRVDMDQNLEHDWRMSNFQCATCQQFLVQVPPIRNSIPAWIAPTNRTPTKRHGGGKRAHAHWIMKSD